jgi:competence protein ComFC
VPISFFRRIKRGYNQNDLIIESFMKSGGKNFINWQKFNLLKWKHTKPQSQTKNRKQRMENQKNAFWLLSKKNIKGRNVILFDDVYTTGATIKEIKKVLKLAGVKKIKVIILAH